MQGVPQEAEKHCWADDVAYGEYVKDRNDTVNGKRFLAALQRHVSRVVWNRVGVDDPDLINDIVVRIVTKEPTHFEGRSQFSTWAHKVATRCCFDHLRSRAKRREISLEGITEKDWRQLKLSNLGGWQILRKQLEGQLSAEERELLARRLRGDSQREIATEWNVTLDTVRNRWYRLRQKLLRLL